MFIQEEIMGVGEEEQKPGESSESEDSESDYEYGYYRGLPSGLYIDGDFYDLNPDDPRDRSILDD